MGQISMTLENILVISVRIIMYQYYSFISFMAHITNGAKYIFGHP
jgi:hypothetical protein